jgi:hypothetical protein
MQRSSLLAAVLVCSATGVLAQQVTMQLMGPPPGPSMAGFYINPYTARIGAAGQTVAPIGGTDYRVICDDFSATITTSTPPWQATQMTLGSLLSFDAGSTTGSTAVKFDHASAATQAFDYVTAAYLANQIFAAETANNTTAQGEYSYALWSIFDSTAMPWLQNNNGDGGAAALVAQSYVTDARNFATGFGGNYSALSSTYSNESIYTPALAGVQELDAWTFTSAAVPVNAPEPSAPALFAVYLSSLVGLILVFRRRVVRAAN